MENEAICVLEPNKLNIKGIIKFKQYKQRCKISYNITGLSPGPHGIHIHKFGNLTDGCESACAHFNPDNNEHGGRNDINRHAGDLGNIVSDKHKIANGFFYDKIISLDYNSKYCILGRMVVIHKDKDDLGKGNNKESLITGNAGKRICCGVIGLSKQSNTCKKQTRKHKKDILHSFKSGLIITAPHGVKVSRTIKKRKIPHKKEYYINSIVSRLYNQNATLSYIIWNKKTTHNKLLQDPNYVHKHQISKNRWNIYLTKFKQHCKEKKKKPFLIDIHGKHKNNFIDIGFKSLLTHKSQFHLSSTQINTLISFIKKSLRSLFHINVKLNKDFDGEWSKDTFTISQQAILLDIPAIQIEMPFSIRKKIVKDPELCKEFSKCLINIYDKYLHI